MLLSAQGERQFLEVSDNAKARSEMDGSCHQGLPTTGPTRVVNDGSGLQAKSLLFPWHEDQALKKLFGAFARRLSIQCKRDLTLCTRSCGLANGPFRCFAWRHGFAVQNSHGVIKSLLRRYQSLEFFEPVLDNDYRWRLGIFQSFFYKKPLSITGDTVFVQIRGRFGQGGFKKHS